MTSCATENGCKLCGRLRVSREFECLWAHCFWFLQHITSLFCFSVPALIISVMFGSSSSRRPSFCGEAQVDPLAHYLLPKLTTGGENSREMICVRDIGANSVTCPNPIHIGIHAPTRSRWMFLSAEESVRTSASVSESSFRLTTVRCTFHQPQLGLMLMFARYNLLMPTFNTLTLMLLGMYVIWGKRPDVGACHKRSYRTGKSHCFRSSGQLQTVSAAVSGQAAFHRQSADQLWYTLETPFAREGEHRTKRKARRQKWTNAVILLELMWHLVFVLAGSLKAIPVGQLSSRPALLIVLSATDDVKGICLSFSRLFLVAISFFCCCLIVDRDR